MQEFAPSQDVVVATEIANALGHNPYEVTIDHEKSAKFKEIVDYMAPYSDRSYLITKLIRGKDKTQAIDHVFRYVSLRKEYDTTKQKFDDITKELSRYER